MYQGLAITDKGQVETIYFLNLEGKLVPHRADGTVVKVFNSSLDGYLTKAKDMREYKRNRYRRMMTYRRLRLEQEALNKETQK